ncbi:hypothetical protein AB833_03815 [Chromatiales bacterium (ex Bugula neritina AB1)]|nr:hypothetical protein AB833_03815 [Chromatiales bacterium (ex Bugula neritina AB1)]
MIETQFIKSSVVAVLACVYLFFQPLEAESATPVEQPNIVLILADDLGYGELGSFGQQLISTPNLDRLAAEGLRLTDHYAGSSVCAASRSVIMTGMHPGHSTIRGNRDSEKGQIAIDKDDVTVAEILKSSGYRTGAFGKWGMGVPETDGDPQLQGFDTFFGYYDQGNAHSYYPEHLWHNGEKFLLDNNPGIPGHARLPADANPALASSYDAYKGTDYAPDRINAAALDFIDAEEERPFFLYYATILPHLALQIPDQYLEPYLGLGWKEVPFINENGVGYTPHLTPKAAYAAMITRMDFYVGQLLERLDERGLTNSTIVVFTSDNGPTPLLNEVDVDFFNSTGDLNGLKETLYEGGIRVPTIIRWPGVVEPNTVSGFVSGFEDWLPTFADVAFSNIEPSALDGISLTPLFRDNSMAQRPFLYREFFGSSGWQAVRARNWKAVRSKLRFGDTDVELYDLENDPGETQNLAQSNPRVVGELVEIMDREHVESDIFPLPSIDTYRYLHRLEYVARTVYHKIRYGL